eukprot:5704368-Alexandrium_andersonii.AAC.1
MAPVHCLLRCLCPLSRVCLAAGLSPAGRAAVGVVRRRLRAACVPRAPSLAHSCSSLRRTCG